MDKENMFFAKSKGRIFACITKPLLIAECAPIRNGVEAFSAAYGELRIDVHPLKTYEDMSSEERFALEEGIIDGYDRWADNRKPPIRKVSKIGELRDTPKWLKAENCVSGRICLFNAREGARLLVTERKGGVCFDASGVTSALVLEAELFLRGND